MPESARKDHIFSLRLEATERQRLEREAKRRYMNAGQFIRWKLFHDGNSEDTDGPPLAA